VKIFRSRGVKFNHLRLLPHPSPPPLISRIWRVPFLPCTNTFQKRKNGRSARFAPSAHASGTLALIPHTGSHRGGTQWHALSAANVRNRCSSRVEGANEHRVGHGMCSDSSSRPVEPDRMRCHATGSRSPASRDALPIIAMVVPKDAGSNSTASRLSSITTRLRRRRSRRHTWLCPPSTFIRPEGV